VYVWENFIQKAPARRIDIVAHSYGGIVTVHLMKTFLNDFQKRVQKIAFTDSVHNLDVQEVSITGKRYINLVGCSNE
jgi:pimeloyl-ACP methyl ester carboxylesterase